WGPSSSSHPCRPGASRGSTTRFGSPPHCETSSPELHGRRLGARVLDQGGRMNRMAMTAKVKDELSRLEVTKPCCRKAEVSTMLRFAGGLHMIGGQIVVEAELDTANTARRLRRNITEVY